MKTLYVSAQEYARLRDNRFETFQAWKDCYVGQTVDIFGSFYDAGFTGTVTEIQDGQCVVEVW